MFILIFRFPPENNTVYNFFNFTKTCCVYLAVLLLMDVLLVSIFSFGVFLCLIYFELILEYRLQWHDHLYLSTFIFIP